MKMQQKNILFLLLPYFQCSAAAIWHLNFENKQISSLPFLVVSGVFSLTHRDDHAVWSALDLINSKSLSLSSITTLYRRMFI